MSRYSGKCDLCDHISGSGGWYDSDGKPTSIGEAKGCLYSDELKDFEAFKKSTGGVIHQHKKIKVDEWNQDFVKKHCKQFDFKQLPKKENERKNRYTYFYWGKEYTLNELNKRGVYITVDIHFDNLLDLIPYYPYIVSIACHDNGKANIYISSRSFVDDEADEHLQWGTDDSMGAYYKKELQQHYLEVVQEYFLPKLKERTKYVKLNDKKIKILKSMRNGDYSFLIEDEIDYMHDLEFVWKDGKNHSHWTSPKLSKYNNHEIVLSKEDVESFLKDDIKNGSVKVKYIKKMDFSNKLI